MQTLQRKQIKPGALSIFGHVTCKDLMDYNQDLKIGDILSLSWGIFGHVTCKDLMDYNQDY